MIDRRRFLERSVLGAGSVLFSSVLLESCTKYGIPLPGGIPHPGGGTPPPLTSEIDWSDAAKAAVTTGLGMIPEAGEILSALADIFWPSTRVDVWGQVRGQTEELVDQQVAAAVYQQVSEDLQRLNNSIIDYKDKIKNGTRSDIKTQWIVTKNLFVYVLPHFQSAGNELPLLGWFVQYANMYLALLRDGVIAGESWGRSAADHQQDITDLKNAIRNLSAYTNVIYKTNRDFLRHTAPNYHLCEPFRTVNTYDRGMTLMILDFRDTWQYYDVTLYPNGAKNPDETPIKIFTREIYSDPYGTANDSGDIDLPSAPKQLPTNLTIWGGDRIQAVQLTYPQGSGPGGVTQTNRMGADGGSNQPPRGGSFNLSPDNPIIQAKVTAGDIVNAMQFVFNDGTTTNILGQTGVDPIVGPLFYYKIDYTNEALSSVHINGKSNFYQCADCVVFGFKYWQLPAAKLNAIRNMYVKSPKEHSMADFAKAFPNLAIPAGLITYELKAARLAYWAYIEERAKEYK